MDKEANRNNMDNLVDSMIIIGLWPHTWSFDPEHVQVSFDACPDFVCKANLQKPICMVVQNMNWIHRKPYSPLARWGLLDFIRALAPSSSASASSSPPPPPAVCINFHLHFRLANSSPSSSTTSQLSVHRWTSTRDLPSSVCTAGPQPGTLPAQCAPLDLNLGPAQLSVHRWTSTGDLPSSVCTAGP